MSLSEFIRERIDREGSISLADYMALALGHPQFGYYMTRDPLGARGDFITAPEISQIFGELCGVWLADCWQQLDSPSPVTLVELGPGRGTLMNDLLRATRQVLGFHEALSIVMVETSPVLQEKQRKLLNGTHARITWQQELQLPDTPLLLIANEFFDALPIHQHVGSEEQRIIWNGKQFDFTLPKEKIRETCPIGRDIVSSIAAHIAGHKGAALIIDYGYVGGSRGDTLQALCDHAYADPLHDPGAADITAHVDFDALADAAKAALVHGPVGQGIFLNRLGAQTRAAILDSAEIRSGLARLTAPEQMGALFKVLGITSHAIVPAGF